MRQTDQLQKFSAENIQELRLHKWTAFFGSISGLLQGFLRFDLWLDNRTPGLKTVHLSNHKCMIYIIYNIWCIYIILHEFLEMDHWWTNRAMSWSITVPTASCFLFRAFKPCNNWRKWNNCRSGETTGMNREFSSTSFNLKVSSGTGVTNHDFNITKITVWRIQNHCFYSPSRLMLHFKKDESLSSESAMQHTARWFSHVREFRNSESEAVKASTLAAMST